MSKKRYWTTMEDLRGDPEVEKLRKEEFRAKPQEYFDAQAKGGLKFGRRDFMKWSTGALALVSTACARKPTQKIIPYAQQPPEITPGVPVYYASTCRECSAGCGIVLTTHEGRPTKVEGNPLHPLNRGTVCARGQASLHNLYDPDRLRTPVRLNRVHSLAGLVGTEAPAPEHLWVPTNVWDEGWNLRDNIHPIKRQMKAVEWLTADLEISHQLMSAGQRAVLLTGTIHGPARTALLADFLGVYAGMRRVVYDSINPDALVAGQQAAYGAAPAAANTSPRYFYDRAEMVVTFGDDPLGAGISRQEYMYGFGHQRKVRDAEAPGRVRMSRVVTFEPALSLTGNSADTRYLVPPSQLLNVAMGLAHQLVLVDKRSAFAADATVAKALQPFNAATVENAAGLKSGTLAAVAGELWQQRGKSIIRGGGMAGATEDAAMLETVAAFLNSVLANEGATVDGTGSPSLQAQGSDAAMLALVNDMNQGKVDTLLVCGSNPAYSLPGAVGFLQALAKVPHVYVIADRLDETAQLSDMVLPLLHGMESWGDAEPQTGLYSIIQPTIEPLFGGRSFEDVLINLAYLNPAGAGKFKALPPPAAPVPPPAPTSATPSPAPAATVAAATAVAAKKTPAAKTNAAKTAAAPAAAAAATPPPSSAAVVAGPMSFYDYLQAYWRTQMYPKFALAASFDDFWTGLLQAGVFDPNPKRLQPGAARTFKAAALLGAPAPAPAAAPNSGELELALVVNPMLGDGWWANNALLQEIPDPVSKNCWDNFFTIAPSTAKRLGLEPDEKRRYVIAEVSVGGQKLQAPVFVQVGVNPGVATIAVGFGRQSVGQIGTDVGANAYSLGQIKSGSNPGLFFSGARVKLTKMGEPNYLLASPQGSNYIDFNDDDVTPEMTVAPGTERGERIIRQTDLVQLQANPRAGNPEQEAPLSLWDNGGASEHSYPNYHWGMTIDLNACVGCNACVAACYQENNVPVVGKDQQWRGRSMAWLRIDRYFSGDEENPDVTQQPMLCQQCANAGCESVCPVIATITDAEGINVQVYNRCVGTRFCSNNCIYKVRVFNFFNYGKVRASPLELALNPMVTIRSKGVMEKCNFCMQRIHAGHYKAKELGLPVQDGDIKTACQQTCPAEAIYFGNMNDPHSRMMQARTPRGYRVLEDMNYQPSIHYLTKIRNLGPAPVAATDQANKV